MHSRTERQVDEDALELGWTETYTSKAGLAVIAANARTPIGRLCRRVLPALFALIRTNPVRREFDNEAMFIARLSGRMLIRTQIFQLGRGEKAAPH